MATVRVATRRLAEGLARLRRRSLRVDYGARYFGEGRDPSGDRQGLSGYASYDRISSNADIAAYLLWRNFDPKSVLEVGCARGYLVEALRELGLDAVGCDVSAYAIEHAAPGATGFVQVEDLMKGLSYPDRAFDLICALEVLEHLEPSQVPTVLAELARVARGALYVTIPSFGHNASGPDGHFEGKVDEDRLDHYRSVAGFFEGPVPFEDLARDAHGLPIEGHLTIASFQWWTDRFAQAGFTRRTDLETLLYRDIEAVGLARFWNLYVFEAEGADQRVFSRRSPESTLPELGLVHPLYEHAASLAEGRLEE